MINTNGYLHDGNWNTKDAANGEFLFAKKGGEEYFLKRFREPKYPKEGISRSTYENMKAECETFCQRREQVNNALRTISTGSGNIVSPFEIFLDKPYYIQSTIKINTSSVGVEEIKDIPEEDFILFLKTLFMSMQKIHKVNIVHGDLKPDNILISKTPANKFVCKIIDFDDSYFACEPPIPEDTVSTQPYWSPELCLYKAIPSSNMSDEKRVKTEKNYAKYITCKSDIFTLGIILHQYCTGGKFPDTRGEKYVHLSSLKNKELKADSNIKPVFLQALINKMLSLNPDERPSSEEIFAILSDPERRDQIQRVEKERLEQAERKEREKQKKVLVDNQISKTKEAVKQVSPQKITKNGITIEKINNCKVRVTFQDGQFKIVDNYVAEAMGWI